MFDDNELRRFEQRFRTLELNVSKMKKQLETLEFRLGEAERKINGLEHGII